MINAEQVREVMDKSEWATNVIWGRCTVVACKLPNGFIIVESSACMDEKNYDHIIGSEECMKRIEDKIWAYMAYAQLEGEVKHDDREENGKEDSKKKEREEG